MDSNTINKYLENQDRNNIKNEPENMVWRLMWTYPNGHISYSRDFWESNDFATAKSVLDSCRNNKSNDFKAIVNVTLVPRWMKVE